MRKVVYSDKMLASVDDYIFWYKKYFLGIYSDTGIFSEHLILEKYEEEAKNRHNEIMLIIHNLLSPEIVLGRTPENTIFFPWRSKTLWLAWLDESNTRIVTDLIIR